MLPVAFTCPLWWVARWAGRLLASLAVVGALTVGAGSPSGALAAPEPAATFAATTTVSDGPGSAAPAAPASRWAAGSGPVGTSALAIGVAPRVATATVLAPAATVLGPAATVLGPATAGAATAATVLASAAAGAATAAATEAPHPGGVAGTGVVPTSTATAGVPAAALSKPSTAGPAPSAPRAPPGA